MKYTTTLILNNNIIDIKKIFYNQVDNILLINKLHNL